MHPPVFTEQTATDPEGAHRLLTAAYGEGRVRFDPGAEPVFAHRRQDLGEVRLDDVQYSFASQYDMDPLGSVLIMRVQDGELEFTDADGSRRLYRTGEVFLCAQPDLAYHAVSRTRHAQAVGLDLSLLERVTDEPAEEVVRRFGPGPLAPPRARHWQRTVDYLGDLLTDEEAVNSPLVLGEAARLLAAATVSAFTAEATETSSERTGSTEATVRRAVAFLEANPDLDLGIVEIAQATHVSIRTLQAAFRRHLDTTPMAYLRRVRLDRVRADLRAAEPGTGVTVTQVATRWGFGDPGRFSAYYRRAYGESPRATLHA